MPTFGWWIAGKFAFISNLHSLGRYNSKPSAIVKTSQLSWTYWTCLARCSETVFTSVSCYHESPLIGPLEPPEPEPCRPPAPPPLDGHGQQEVMSCRRDAANQRNMRWAEMTMASFNGGDGGDFVGFNSQRGPYASPGLKESKEKGKSTYWD